MDAQRNKSNGSARFNESASGAVLQMVHARQFVAHGAAADPGEEHEALAMFDSNGLVRVSDAVLRSGGQPALRTLGRPLAQPRCNSVVGESDRGLR